MLNSFKTVLILLFITLIIPCSGVKNDEKKTDSVSTKDTNNIIIIDPIETYAEFSGGYDSLKMYLKKNNRLLLGKSKCQGKVYVEFVIENDGSVTNIKIYKGLDEECNKEAIRLIEQMPKWKPGELQGHPVREKVKVPISFDYPDFK